MKFVWAEKATKWTLDQSKSVAWCDESKCECLVPSTVSLCD